MLKTLTDKIKLRKIRYDVIEHLEMLDFLTKINDFLDNKEKYKDNIEYIQDLLRQANLDITEKDFDKICTMFDKYIEEHNNVDSLEHLPLLDYAQDYIDLLNKNNVDEMNLDNAEAKLDSFILQMTEITNLQNKMIDSAIETMHIDEEGNVLDDNTNEVIVTTFDIQKDTELAKVENLERRATMYIARTIVRKQRQFANSLDFDDDGYYIAPDGTELFSEEEKEELEQDVLAWKATLLGITPDDIKNELAQENDDSDNDNSEINEDVFSSIDDDVSIAKNEISDATKERVGRLQSSLKDSANKIKKF